MTDRTVPLAAGDARAIARALPRKLRAYWTLTKHLQTGLLLITGLAGYVSGHPSRPTWAAVLALLGSLFLTVGGSTVLNMVIDHDIDERMGRTRDRPIPAGLVKPVEGLILGTAMVALGLLWATRLSGRYGATVAAGVLIDVLVYTCWLKRRTAWSIIWGGIAGGMPAMAGRVLATGRIDAIGIWLALSVLLWIPTHMMTFGIKYADDYAAAGVPIFPSRYGITVTRVVIGISTIGAAVVMLWAMYALGLAPVPMWVARALGGLLCAFTLVTILRRSSRLNAWLYKLASLYMLGSMIVLIAGA